MTSRSRNVLEITINPFLIISKILSIHSKKDKVENTSNIFVTVTVSLPLEQILESSSKMIGALPSTMETVISKSTLKIPIHQRGGGRKGRSKNNILTNQKVLKKMRMVILRIAVISPFLKLIKASMKISLQSKKPLLMIIPKIPSSW